MQNVVRNVALAALIVALAFAGDALAQYGWPQQAPVFRGPSAGDLFASRFGTLAIAAVLGLAIGAFFSPALRQFRRIAMILLAAGAVAFGLFGPYPQADALNIPIAILLFFIMVGIGLRLGVEAAVRAEEERPTSFGSAQWATLPYLQRHGIIGERGTWRGFMLGEFRTGGGTYPLRYEGARHLLTVAPTRSGKGVSAIIPNLLTYEGSALIVDPKGENALVTAPRRADGSTKHGIQGLGQTVLLLDPWDLAASKLGGTPACFNPLDWIRAGDPDAAENAFLLADALVPTDDSSGEHKFWDEEAKALLTGIILHVATAEAEAGRRTLGRVRDILVQGEDALRETLNAMFNHPNPVVSSTAERTAAKDPKLRSSVFAGAQAHTHFLDSPRIRASLSRSDFRFEDLKTSAMTVYLILPADRLKTFDRWLRLLVQQAIMVNARNIDVKPKRPILFLLDEMAAIGRLASVEQAYGLMAGFGMQLWGIVQDLSQLSRIYGETGWQTFISNSGVIQYFGSRDKMTAEYFSSLCGVTTVIVRNLSWAIGRVLGSSSSATSSGQGGSHTSGSSESSSTTRTTGFNESQRHLAYPDELMVLKGNEQIIFVENLDPIRGEKVLWYRDGALARLGVNLHGPQQLAPEQLGFGPVAVPAPSPAPAATSAWPPPPRPPEPAAAKWPPPPRPPEPARREAGMGDDDMLARLKAVPLLGRWLGSGQEGKR